MYTYRKNIKKNVHPGDEVYITYGKAGPIKHWRKQYVSTENCNSTLNVIKDNKCDGIMSNNICEGGTSNLKRNASTVIKNNYYPSRTEYLKARNKTYMQNISKGEHVSGNIYKMSNAIDNSCAVLNYKKSNPTYGTDGSISSSLNITRLHNESSCSCNVEPSITPCVNKKININL